MSKGFGDTRGCPVSYIRFREHHASKPCWSPSTAHTTFLSKRLDLAKNLYRRDLFAHYGCVNAIEFSQEGCLLISGGDDRRVLLWNLEACVSGDVQPVAMKEEHGSNIFCLAFDYLNQKIFSAGNDERVIIHDVKTGKTVSVTVHNEAIYGVSVNPFVDSVFASAGEDGQILIFDIRAPAGADPLLLARSYDAFHAVQFHPVEPMFVVTANSKEGVILWDVRKPRIPFVKYGDKRSSESSMCARFNGNGTQIVALRRRMHPVLFNTHSAMPVCEFDADHYYNSCTMKSCCFAGFRDQFILSGSDDFNLYMWRIPDSNSGVKFIPEAHLILKGHRSIVNQVRFNRHNFTIASSGVEKIVKLWSPVPEPGSYGSLDSETEEAKMTRRVYTHDDYIGLILDSGQQMVSHDYSHGSTSEDPKMMAFFDSLVQREVEGWTTNTDLSDDDSGSNPPTPPGSDDTSSSPDSDSDATWAPSQSALPGRSRSRRGQRDRKFGSEWILRLIAKKRAQLLAAKKRRMASNRNRKSKAKQFIRCFTSSKQYLYRPENNQSGPSSAHTTRTVPPDLLRRRHTVAPYTVMSLGSFPEVESDGDTDDGSPDRSCSSDDDKPAESSLELAQREQGVVQLGQGSGGSQNNRSSHAIAKKSSGNNPVDDKQAKTSLELAQREHGVVQLGQGAGGSQKNRSSHAMLKKVAQRKTRGRAGQLGNNSGDNNSSLSDTTDDFNSENISKGANSRFKKTSADSNQSITDSVHSLSGSVPSTSYSAGVSHIYNVSNSSELEIPILGSDLYNTGSLNQLPALTNDFSEAGSDGSSRNNQRYDTGSGNTSSVPDVDSGTSTLGGVMPITGISTDESGSLLFDLSGTGTGLDIGLHSTSNGLDIGQFGTSNGLDIGRSGTGFDMLNRIGSLGHSTGTEYLDQTVSTTPNLGNIVSSTNGSFLGNSSTGNSNHSRATSYENEAYLICRPSLIPKNESRNSQVNSRPKSRTPECHNRTNRFTMRTPEGSGVSRTFNRTPLLNPYLREGDFNSDSTPEIEGNPRCLGDTPTGADGSSIDANNPDSVINTPDSGISMTERSNGDSSTEGVVKPVFRKKKIPESRLKNYRYRSPDTEEIDE